MSWKKVLLGCSIVSGVLVIILAVMGYFAFRRFSGIAEGRLKMPSDLEKPSVLVGSGFISRTPYFTYAGLGDVTDIVSGELDPAPGPEIGVAGSAGAVFLDKDANVKSTVTFDGNMGHVDIIDVEGDGVCEFLNRGSWVEQVVLIDHNGNTSWTYGGMGVDDAAPGDVDGDGDLEFAVGFNGFSGIHLVSAEGSKLWQQSDGNVWHVEMVDLDGDGKQEIVHSNARGAITVRDQGGKIVSQASPGAYFAAFSICRWPTGADREYALMSADSVIHLFEFNGKIAATFSAPKCGQFGHARGTPVKIKQDHPEYLAVLVEFQNWERSILYVYDSDGKLVYQEILPESCGSMKAMSLPGSNTETLLVGGKGKIWKYE